MEQNELTLYQDDLRDDDEKCRADEASGQRCEHGAAGIRRCDWMRGVEHD